MKLHRSYLLGAGGAQMTVHTGRNSCSTDWSFNWNTK